MSNKITKNELHQDLVTSVEKVATIEQNLLSHQAENASLTTKGHVQLSSSTTSTDETMAATPKAVKDVKDAVPTLNNTVTSTSTTQAATANAVKTAYDKAVAAGGYVTGTYTGDEASTKTISLGFTPSAVFVIPENGELYNRTNDWLYGGLAVGSYATLGKDMFYAVRIVTGGFTVHMSADANVSVRTNEGDPAFNPFRYVAFK